MEKSIFLQKAIEIYGHIYDYSLVPEKFRTKDKLPIICKNHGVFYKDVDHHIGRKQGCPECMGKKRRSEEEFIDKIKSLPDISELSFENTHYINNKSKIKIYCHHKDENGVEHGEFEISPGHFLSGQRCPKCRYIKSAKGRRREIDEIINEARKVHGDKYDYSLILDYKNDREKYPIVCPEHGIFYQAMNNHIKAKQGCPICGRIKCDGKRKLSFEDFVERANFIHENKYTYNESSYTTTSDYVTINCPKHGEFRQRGVNHIDLGQGCPKCGTYGSKAETEIYEFLCELMGRENVVAKKRGLIGGEKELDIYIPSKHFAIEFNGLHWHCELLKENDYHLKKTEECNNVGIRLFHIFEDEWAFKKEILKSMLKNLLVGNEHRIFARKCEIKEVSTKDAQEFLNENHLQGYCPSKIRYGLYYNGILVSLMTFGKTRHFVGNGNHEWELLRFCNRLNHSVIGGASKLLSHFIRNFNPKEIISYADRRWSDGNLYDKIGFTLYNRSKPNYYYIIGNKRIYRYNLRKDILVKKYDCPENMTEREFCFSQKWYRIYDCGCLCYIWKQKK